MVLQSVAYLRVYNWRLTHSLRRSALALRSIPRLAMPYLTLTVLVGKCAATSTRRSVLYTPLSYTACALCWTRTSPSTQDALSHWRVSVNLSVDQRASLTVYSSHSAQLPAGTFAYRSRMRRQRPYFATYRRCCSPRVLCLCGLSRMHEQPYVRCWRQGRARECRGRLGLLRDHRGRIRCRSVLAWHLWSPYTHHEHSHW